MDIKRIIRLVLACLFLLFALVQFNDPDPWVWVGLYGLVGLTAGYSALRLVPTWVYWALAMATLILMAPRAIDFYEWLVAGMPSITGEMKAENPRVELVREFLGLGMCGLALAWLIRKNPG